MDIAQIVMQTIEGIIAKNEGATLEQINDELIIKGLELGFLDLLKNSIPISLPCCWRISIIMKLKTFLP